MYMFVPVAFVFGLIFMQQGSPMTFHSTEVSTPRIRGDGHDDKGEAKPQTIVVGPVAAFIPMKMLGTNGGGFYGMNSAHPFENPTAMANFFTTLAMMIFPFALVLMYGRMLGRFRHSLVIFGVMMVDDDRAHRLVDLFRHAETEPRIDRARRGADVSDPQPVRRPKARST